MFELAMPMPSSLPDLAADRLREAIVAGHFKPGERLVEMKISASLGISRAPLREALRTLANDGLVEIRQNRGCFVARPSEEDLERATVFRALIEGTAARFVAFERNPAVLSQLGKAFEAMRDADARADTVAFVRSLWEFHREICSAPGNPLVMQSWNLASNITRLYQHMVVGVSIPRATVLENNAAILKALRSADPDEAERQVRSRIIFLIYQYFGRPVPGALRGYVTHLTPVEQSASAGKRRKTGGPKTTK